MRFFLFSAFLRAKFWLGWWRTWAILVLLSAGFFCAWTLLHGGAFHPFSDGIGSAVITLLGVAVAFRIVFGGLRGAYYSAKLSPQNPSKIAIENRSESLRGIGLARKEAALLAREVQRGARLPPDRAPSGADPKSETASQSRPRRL